MYIKAGVFLLCVLLLCSFLGQSDAEENKIEFICRSPDAIANRSRFPLSFLLNNREACCSGPLFASLKGDWRNKGGAKKCQINWMEEAEMTTSEIEVDDKGNIKLSKKYLPLSLRDNTQQTLLTQNGDEVVLQGSCQLETPDWRSGTYGILHLVVSVLGIAMFVVLIIAIVIYKWNLHKTLARQNAIRRVRFRVSSNAAAPA